MPEQEARGDRGDARAAAGEAAAAKRGGGRALGPVRLKAVEEQADDAAVRSAATRVRGSSRAEESESGRWAAGVRELGSRREGEVGRGTAHADGSGEGRRAEPAGEARGQARCRLGREAAGGPGACGVCGHGDAAASGRQGSSRTL